MVVADRRTKNPVRGGGQLAQRKKKFHNKKIGEVKEARERERERERERKGRGLWMWGWWWLWNNFCKTRV